MGARLDAFKGVVEVDCISTVVDTTRVRGLLAKVEEEPNVMARKSKGLAYKG